MSDGRQGPRADTASLSASAEDRIGGNPQQLDLWPAPRNGAFKTVQSALDGWKPFERSADGAQPRLGSDRAAHPKLLLLDSTGNPERAPSWEEISPPDRDELVVAAPRAVIRAFRPAVVAAALVAALALGWAGGWGSYHLMARAPAPAPLKQADASDCASDPGGETACAAAKLDREIVTATVNAQSVRKAAAPAASKVVRGHEPPRAAAAQQAANKDPLPIQNAAAAAERAKSSPRLVPVPETRPTTIEGWTVREVVGGTAVLEGPDGVWRAARGETVPGLGRVDSIVRWGNRWIVATSRGLISTAN
jgi:hypothetical protein